MVDFPLAYLYELLLGQLVIIGQPVVEKLAPTVAVAPLPVEFRLSANVLDERYSNPCTVPGGHACLIAGFSVRRYDLETTDRRRAIALGVAFVEVLSLLAVVFAGLEHRLVVVKPAHILAVVARSCNDPTGGHLIPVL